MERTLTATERSLALALIQNALDVPATAYLREQAVELRRQRGRLTIDAFVDEVGIASVVGVEAACEKCGEVFNPNGDEDTVDRDGLVLFEHYASDGGSVECGGFGPLVGAWGT